MDAAAREPELRHPELRGQEARELPRREGTFKRLKEEAEELAAEGGSEAARRSS